MEHRDCEVLIIKPTPVFFSSFKAEHPLAYSSVALPLPEDNTAYTLWKTSTEDELLEEIETHFQAIYKYEVSRWFGEPEHDEIHISFLDFLCRFKFEFHSQVVLMEPSIRAGKQLISIKPRSVFIQWMESAVADKEEQTSILERLNLARLVNDSTVVIKNFSDEQESDQFMRHYYHSLLSVELSRMSNNEEQWPLVESFEAFNRFFSVETHTHLVHLR